jgi:hypothetical protein
MVDIVLSKFISFKIRRFITDWEDVIRIKLLGCKRVVRQRIKSNHMQTMFKCNTVYIWKQRNYLVFTPIFQHNLNPTRKSMRHYSKRNLANTQERQPLTCGYLQRKDRIPSMPREVLWITNAKLGSKAHQLQ